jgi:hypothetical protein
MQLRPTDTYMDNFVAPSYSAFTAATIPDAPEDPEEKQWVASFLLNSTFRATLDNNSRRAFYNFLRRTHFAFVEYGEARRLTIEHLADPSTRRYLNAIGHWERFLSDADRAWELLDRGQRISSALKMAPICNVCAVSTTARNTWRSATSRIARHLAPYCPPG